MARSKKIKVAQILSDVDIRYLAERTQKLLHESFPSVFEKNYSEAMEDSIRFLSVAQKCSARRQSKSISIKEVAKAIGAPQYRLKDIEQCSFRDVQVPIRLRYIDFLGLKRWFGQWKVANRSLAERLGLESDQDPKAQPKIRIPRKE